MLRMTLSFDYDSPAGYRESFHMRDFPANADEQGTEEILKVLTDYGVKATFGIVGHAALEGNPPENCQDQIRKIYRLGHEIASHSMNHRYLPSMQDAELKQEIEDSKNTLEKCTQGVVRGFIPPFNRPMHFPSRGAFSLSEMFGTFGRGKGRQSIESLLRQLRELNYGWCRISFESKFSQVFTFLKMKRGLLLDQPFILNDVVAIPLHGTGFGEEAERLMAQAQGTASVLCLYGHPNQAFAANDQSAKQLGNFFKKVQTLRQNKEIDFFTMAEIENQIREGYGKRN